MPIKTLEAERVWVNIVDRYCESSVVFLTYRVVTGRILSRCDFAGIKTRLSSLIPFIFLVCSQSCGLEQRPLMQGRYR